LKQDESKAVPLLTKAAEKGVAGAMNRLAHLHLEGVAGVTKSTAEAAKWRLLAKSRGISDDKLDLLLEALPDKEREAAQKAAQEWQDKRLTLR
jgi:TPR repeat protein